MSSLPCSQDTVSGRGVFSNVVKAKDTKSEGPTYKFGLEGIDIAMGG